MPRKCLTILLILFAPAVLYAQAPEAASTQDLQGGPKKVVGGVKKNDVPVQEPPVRAQNVDLVQIRFPAREGGAAEKDQKTGWDIEWDFVQNPAKTVHLLRIVSAKFHFRDRAGAWKSVVVARNIELAEAFAPYDDNFTSFLDLANKGRANRTVLASEKLKGPKCVVDTEIVKWSGHKQLNIYKEVHDDGIRWIQGGKPSGIGENVGVRGEKLILRSAFQAVNYVYMIEYQFTDDGRIIPRLGFTGYNFFPRGKGNAFSKDPVEGDVHLHVGCWRMEFDLGSPANNSYELIRREYDIQAKRFRVKNAPFNNGNEGKARWDAKEFTTLRVVGSVEKSLAGTKSERPIAYELISSRAGSVRDLKGYMDTENAKMEFINYDFWITQQQKGTPYHQVPDLAKGQRPLNNQPATVWYNVPALHVPRGEDFGTDGGAARNAGVALTTWIEFTLRPRDLFDSTPYYP